MKQSDLPVGELRSIIVDMILEEFWNDLEDYVNKHVEAQPEDHPVFGPVEAYAHHIFMAAGFINASYQNDEWPAVFSCWLGYCYENDIPFESALTKFRHSLDRYQMEVDNG